MDTQAPRNARFPVNFGLFEHAPVPMACSVLAPNGHTHATYWNHAWLNTFGYESAQVQGQPGRSFGLWVGDLFQLKQARQDMHKQRHQFDLALRHANGDTRQVTVTVTGHTLRQDGQVLVLSYFDDHTEQRAQETQLQELRVMAETSSDGMLLMEDDLIVECNPAASRMYQLPREQLIGKHPRDFAPPEETLRAASVEMADTAINQASHGQAQRLFWEHVRPDGSLFSTDAWINPVPNVLSDGASQHRMCVVVMRDVSETRQTTLALENSERRFRDLFELAPVPLVLTDREGEMLAMNQQYQQVFGYQLEEIRSAEAWWQTIFPDPTYRERMHTLMLRLHHEQMDAGHDVLDIECVLRCKDGTDRTMLVSFTDIGDEVLAQFHDITEIRAAQHELEHLNTELESRVTERTHELQLAIDHLQHTQSELVRSEKLASLGSLVASIAHELNTPIGNAVMVASTLSDLNTQLSSELAHGLRRSSLERFLADWHEATEVIERNLQRAAELIASFKQVAVDQSSYQRRPFDLAEVLHELRLTLSPSLRRARVELIEDASPGLRMDSYPGPLTQVLMNVVNNAVVHAFPPTAPGHDQSVPRTVHIDARPLGSDQVRITVSDNGCGIPPQVLPRVFDPFFTTRLGQGGSGLGLHIVYSLVTELLAGSVSIDSSPGNGCTLSFILPLVAPPAGSPQA